MNLTVIGLGKLGLPLAVLHAQHHRVFGVDLNRECVAWINKGISPVAETDLEPRLAKVVHSGRLTAHTDYSVVAQTDMSMVIVPTPSMGEGEFSSKYVLDAVREIGHAIKKETRRHIVVICSTVMPGECDGVIRATLEQASGRVVGEDLGLIYSPEFIALGTVLHDMQFPDLIMIGESDSKSGEAYAEVACLIANVAPHLPPIHHMSLTNAEIAKIAINSYVTMKISFANTLGEICEKYPDADAHVITRAIGQDHRIGRSYIRPGGPYGGPCFPRDNRAFALVGQRVGVEMQLARATDDINQRQVDRVMRVVSSFRRPSVGILGMSYKPGTPVTEESFGMKLALECRRRDLNVTVYEPMFPSRPTGLPDDVHVVFDPALAFGNSMVTILACPSDKFTRIVPIAFSNEGRDQSVLIDCWDFLPEGPWDATHIVRLGKYLGA